MSVTSDLLMRRLPRALWHASAWRGLDVVEDLHYADRPGCRLDVLRPRDVSGPLPVVVHVHGGAFRVLSKETHGYPAAMYARAGFLVLNVDYRLAPADPYPAAVQDVHDAFVWAVQQVEALGGDPQRILLTGESAGGNLVLGLALSSTVDRPEPWARQVRALGVRPAGAHVVCGFLQATDTARYGRDVPVGALVGRRLPIIERDYVGGSDPAMSLDYADPIRMVEGLSPGAELPPILSVCGTDDPIAHDSERLAAELMRLGSGHDSVWVSGAGHGFHTLPGRRSSEAWRHLLDHARGAVEIG